MSEIKAQLKIQPTAIEEQPKINLANTACAEQFKQLNSCVKENGENGCAEIAKILANCKEENGL
jgi:hypothetical protein